MAAWLGSSRGCACRCRCRTSCWPSSSRSSRSWGPRGALNQPGARPLTDPNDLGYLLLAAAGLVLLARRRWPEAVFATAAAVSLVYYAAGYPDGPGTVGLFVAVYTLTAQGDGHRSLWIAAAGIAVLSVVWLAVAEVPPFNAAGWVLFRIGTAVMAAALGESVRGRRVLAAEALERASGPSGPGTRRRGGGSTPSGCGSPGRSTTPSPTPSP